MLKPFLTCCLLSLLALSPLSAFAQGAGLEKGAVEAESVEYQQAVQAALEEYRLQHYEEARSLFERAHQLDPNARTLRGLGMVEFELRHYVRAAELLEQALASDKKPLTAEQRAAVEELLGRTNQFIALYNLEVQPGGSELQVDLDGKRVELRDHTLSLEAGEHVLRISAPGAEPRELHIDVKGGERQTLRIELEVHQKGDAPPPPAAVKVSPSRRRAAIGLMSAGGAVLAGGVVLGVLAMGDAKDAPTQESSEADRAKGMAIGADVAIGLGAAAAILGLVLRLTEPKGEQRVEAQSSWRGAQLGVRF